MGCVDGIFWTSEKHTTRLTFVCAIQKSLVTEMSIFLLAVCGSSLGNHHPMQDTSSHAGSPRSKLNNNNNVGLMCVIKHVGDLTYPLF